ncbi:EexN family lipoprotein [Pantoea agglomerans]|uniref:EexN family lipoprotein n=1 Tax=Enterobacter agglomerans TaxID=549 RepID=UPI00320B262F
MLRSEKILLSSARFCVNGRVASHLIASLLLATTLLTGWDAGAKGIDWYKAHDAERKAKYEECTKAFDPRDTEDCRNAIDATVHGGSFTKSPNKSW